jgi:hypothetical protein
MTPTPTARRAGRRVLLGALAALGVSAVVGVAAFAAVHHHSSRSSGAVVRIVASTPRPPLTLAVYDQPSGRTVAAGADALYRLRIGRHASLVRRRGPSRVAARIWMSVTTALPGRVVATFDPRSTRATRTTLTLRTSADTRPGTYRVRLTARGRLHPGPQIRMRHAQTIVTLVVVRRQDAPLPAPAVSQPPAASPAPAVSQPPTTVLAGAFSISGNVAGLLAPGVAAPLDLILTNPHPYAMGVIDLTVRVSAVHAPQADAAHPCTIDDFAVGDFSGTYGFALPASSTTSLSALGFTEAELPDVVMLQRPINQNGCKLATLTLAFAGTATDAPR